MKSHKEIRLLSAILLFVASGIMFFSTVFLPGIPARFVIYAIVSSGAFAYIGVSLIVFKEKMRLLNIVSFAIIALVVGIQAFELIGIFVNTIPNVSTNPADYVSMGGVLIMFAIAVIMLVNAIKKFNILLTYAVLSLAYLGAFIAFIILVPSSIQNLDYMFGAIAEMLALFGLGVAFFYYNQVDKTGSKEKVCLCVRRELAKAKVLKAFADLQKDGAITQKEFDAKKATLL